jgi:predicted transposase/invertase (TIGR01784 family)
MPNNHDDFFKKLFSYKEHARDFTKGFLPQELLENIDLSTIEYENTSYIDKYLKKNFSDTVYSCSLNNKTQIKISLLFEHKSRPDQRLPFQLLRYMTSIWETDNQQKKKPVPVIPVVFYHGKESWTPKNLISSFDDYPAFIKNYIPDYNFLFVNIGKYSDEEIKSKIMDNATLKLGILVIKNIYNPKVLENSLKDYFELVKIYFEQEKSLNFIEAVLNYIYKATEIETSIVVNSLKDVSKTGGELAMTTAEKLRQEGMQEGMQQGIQQGMQKGIQQGMQKGRQEGMQKGIELSIAIFKKFGQTSDTIKAVSKIKYIYDPEIINKLMKQLKTCSSIKDFEKIIMLYS